MRHFEARALLFDMDGTLIDSNEASEVTWQRWAFRHGVPIERIRAVHHGRQPEETIALVAPHVDARAEAARISAEFEATTAGIYPIPGANALFRSVPPTQLAIVTAATRRILELRLQLVGLVPPAVCVTGDTLAAGKPDPRGYLEAAHRLGVEPKRCLVFEDAPSGLLAAHRAGMRAVAILSHYSEAQLREELGDTGVPAAFITTFAGASYRDGVLLLHAATS